MKASDLIALVSARKVVPVVCPEIGVTLHVRSLSATEMETLRDSVNVDDDNDVASQSIAAFLCDEEGTPLMSLQEAVQFVAAGDGRPARRVFREGSILNSVSKVAIEAAQGN